MGGGAGAGVDMARGGLPPLLAGGTVCGVATATGLLTGAGWGITVKLEDFKLDRSDPSTIVSRFNLPVK